MKKILSLLIVFFSLSMFAEETPIQLQEGENNLKVVPFMEAVYAEYEATADGTVDIVMWYERFDPEVNGTKVNVTGSAPTYFAQAKEVKKGEKVVFKKEFCQNADFQIIITMLEGGKKPNIMPIDFTPKANIIFPWNTAGEVTVQFNRSVYASSAYIVVNGTKIPAGDLRAGSSFLSCNIKEALNDALAKGILLPNRPFNVRFEGICDAFDPTNLYGGTGTLLVTYGGPQPQSELESANFNTTEAELKSFYSPDGEEGLFTLTFTQPLNKDYAQTHATLTYGDVDQAIAGYYYSEELPIIFDGNKLTVDLRGKIRTQASMWPNADQTAEVPELIDTERLALSINNVQDANGNFVNSPGIGTVGSYTFMLRLTKIDMTDFYMDLLPATSDKNPSAIKPGDKIDFWFSNPDLFTLGTPMGFDIYTGEELKESIYYKYLIDEYNEEAEEHVYSTGYNYDAPIEFIEQDGGKSVILTMPELDLEIGTVIKVVAVGISTADGISHDYHATYTYGDSEANGIHSVSATKSSQAIYNLHGQRVNTAALPGLYIQQGKKVVVK